MKTAIERVIRALDDIRAGKMVILVDDEDRENEGDLTMAAEMVTPEAINFMARHGRGLICLTLDEAQIARLKLPMMVTENQAALHTAFTVSIEARRGVTTGISARDRATTILTAIADDARPEDLVSPGHVFPLKARPGGVLVRTGQTESSVDLARLAGLKPAGVICEIMRDDGEMARMPELERFSAEHDIAILSIADLIAYRLQHERIVHCRATGEIRPVALGPGEPFQCYVYQNIKVVRHAQADLPAVLIDPGQLQEVVTSLVLTAVDAMEERGVLTVETTTEPDQPEVIIRIADTGRGIPPEAMPFIFEPFFTTKKVGQGTGLGLAIVHGIVTRAGGRVEVSSSPRGATFTVRLPVSREEAGDAAAEVAGGRTRESAAGR